MWILVLIASAVILALTAKLALLYRDLDRICDTLDERLREIGRGEVVDGVGRGVALDRDGNYEKIRRAYEAMVLGRGAEYR